MRCHCAYAYTPQMHPTLKSLCEKCQSLSSSVNLSDHHSSMTRRERSKGKLHIFDFLFGTDESAYNAVIILIIAHPSFTTFLSHVLFRPRDFRCLKCALVNSFEHRRKLYQLIHMTNRRPPDIRPNPHLIAMAISPRLYVFTKEIRDAA